MPRRSSGRRTDFSWSAMGDVVVAQDIGIDASFGPTGSLVNQAQTLMRIRGTVGVTLDTGAVNESVVIVCGVVIVTADNFSVGGPPDFQVNGLADEGSWVWQGSLYLSSGAEAAIIGDGLIATVEVDTKAMRRLKPNDTVAFVHQAPAALAIDQGGTYDISYYLHCLAGS